MPVSLGNARHTMLGLALLGILGMVLVALLSSCGWLARTPRGAAPQPGVTPPAQGAPPAAALPPDTGASEPGLPPVATVPAGSQPASAAPAEPAMQLPTGRGRWVAADWAALPGWADDGVIHAWPALLRSCERATGDWVSLCDAARALPSPDETTVRAFLREKLRPWRVETHEGQADGMMTGYYEPLIEASRTRSARFSVPLYAPPADIETRLPWYTRAQIDTLPAARQALRGREIAWVADPLDALVLQIQGSGRILFKDGSRQQLVRLAYAAHNGQPYQSVGRWLVEQNAFTLDQASWPAIKEWARANPRRVKEMLHANPRYVFFREEPLPDPTVGPLGAQGVPLTPGRSIAVDKESIPYGTPVWIASTEPAAWPAGPLQPGAAAGVLAAARPLQRLVIAQDTGAAITGAVRADYFWGWGQGADHHAGRMKQPLRMWALWPKGR